MKKIFLIALFVLLTYAGFAYSKGESTAPQSEPLEKKLNLDVIVIDPGHGGNDVGAISNNSVFEKDVTLKIAKRLKALIEKGTKVKVYLTRERDQYLSLTNRRRLAAEKGADVFVSIHANASKFLSISGCETFFFDTDASDEQAKLLAEIENKGGLSKNDELNDPLQFILMDMVNSEIISLSYRFAEIIQKEYVKSVKSRDRGVKQAPFTVLAGAKMPAVLTEIGFLSSKKDGSRLEDKEYLENIAKALYESVKRFKEITDIKNGKLTKADK